MARIFIVSCLSRLPYYIKCFGIPIVASGLLVVSCLVGCGERLESARYYYSPSFTKEGKIIFVGGIQSVRKDILGSQLGSSYSEYVATMHADGTGESSSLFDATGAPPYAMSCSPSRSYVAYMDDLRSGLYGKIVIRNITAESYTGMQDVELLFNPSIKSFDWSADGNKLVYSTTQEVRLRDWNDFVGTTDTLVTSESNLEFVSWKYGGRVAFVYTAASGTARHLSLVYSDGSGRTDITTSSAVDKPQISSSNTNEVYGIAGSSYVKVTVTTYASAEVAANFSGEMPYLSPNADKVVYSKSGESSGIYVLDIAAGTETKVK